MNYIATDKGGRDRWVAIYGVGETAAEAIEDARQWCDYEGRNPDSGYDTLPACDRLVAHVREHGGAPDDVRWAVIDGVAVCIDAWTTSADVVIDAGGWNVRWYREDAEGRSQMQCWYGARDECYQRAAGPAPRSGWHRCDYDGSVWPTDAATATGMYDHISGE